MFFGKSTAKESESSAASAPTPKTVSIQARLAIGAVNDPLELQADAMAERVMRMPEAGLIQRKCTHCEEEEKAQRKPLSSQITPFIQAKGTEGGIASESLARKIQATRGAGNPMPEGIKNFMESRFGADFSNVRIHTGSEATALSEEINAQAFTVGNDIYFKQGKYAPGPNEGTHLLAHELTHVLQQNKSNTRQLMRQEASSPSPRLRIPVLETAAMQYGFLGGNRYPLSSARITTAREIFGNSIVYSAVSIVETNVISAPTTLGNNIRIPPGYTLDNSTLIHELTHIWQFQNRGTGYISDSLTHQFAAILGAGDRNAAYNYVIVPGQPFDHYTAEHQAMIVEDYYRQPSKRNDPEFQRLIAQVRNAKPTFLSDLDRYNEALYGPSFNNSDILNMPAGSRGGGNGGGTVPLIRIEF